MKPTNRWLAAALSVALLALATSAEAQKKRKRNREAPAEDPYALYVWPPPPDKPRIKLEAVLRQRSDIEASSRFTKMLIGVEPKAPWDVLQKPYDVAFDPKERLLVTDPQTGGLVRFDLEEHRFDVFGTSGAVQLKAPYGLDVADDGDIFVADGTLRQVVVFDSEGGLKAGYRVAEFQRPVDVVVAESTGMVYVSDSLAHKIWVLDRESGKVLNSIGTSGEDPGEFHTPTSLALAPDGNLAVVDQLNGRVQIFTPDGELVDILGKHGNGLGSFSRPKGIAIDEIGFIYVTDFLQNFVQLFDYDFTLLTFIGSPGREPGQFDGTSGVAVHGDRFAVVDQLGARLQVFRFIVPKTEK